MRLRPDGLWRPAKRNIFPRRFGLSGGVAFLFVGITCSLALAHSWYPIECCHNQDCVVADGISTNGSGETIVTVGDLNIRVPPSFTPRPSPDNHVHICFTLDASRSAVVRCLFLPGIS
jgi:hypothetical protein